MIRDHAATIAQLISPWGIVESIKIMYVQRLKGVGDPELVRARRENDFEMDIGDDEIHLIYTTYDGGRKVRTTLVVTDAVFDTESDWRSFD